MRKHFLGPHIFHEIKVLREDVGMKQYVLAEKLGICQTNYSKIESGKLIPNSIEDLKKKALDILKIPLENEILNQRVKLSLLEFNLRFYK